MIRRPTFVACLTLLVAGCATGSSTAPKPLKPGALEKARTALVLDTRLDHRENPVMSNDFSLILTGSMDEVEVFEDHINPFNAIHGDLVRRQTADGIHKALSEPGAAPLQLEGGMYFQARQFPALDDRDAGFAHPFARDWRRLAREGYTHVLKVNFPNVWDVDRNHLVFGFEGVLFDIRDGAGLDESGKERENRVVWRYRVIPELPQPGTTHPPGFHVVSVHDTGEPCTFEEFFPVKAPLYGDIYWRAAVHTMLLAMDHMTNGDMEPFSKVADVDVLLRAPLPWEIRAPVAQR